MPLLIIILILAAPVLLTILAARQVELNDLVVRILDVPAKPFTTTGRATFQASDELRKIADKAIAAINATSDPSFNKKSRWAGWALVAVLDVLILLPLILVEFAVGSLRLAAVFKLPASGGGGLDWLSGLAWI